MLEKFFVYHKEIKHLCQVLKFGLGVYTIEYDCYYREWGMKFQATDFDDLYKNCCANPFEIVTEELDTIKTMIELIS